MKLDEYISLMIDAGNFSLSDTENEFVAKGKRFGICGTCSRECWINYNLAGCDFQFKDDEGKNYKFSWKSLYNYIQQHYGNKQLTFWEV